MHGALRVATWCHRLRQVHWNLHHDVCERKANNKHGVRRYHFHPPGEELHKHDRQINGVRVYRVKVEDVCLQCTHNDIRIAHVSKHSMIECGRTLMERARQPPPYVVGGTGGLPQQHQRALISKPTVELSITFDAFPAATACG